MQDHIASVVMDIANNYNIDGVVLDGCRYLRPEVMYNPICLALYKSQTGTSDTPSNDDPNWKQWRRQQVTALVKKVHDRLAAAKPSARLSATVMTPMKGAAEYCMQDYGIWIQDGLVDSIVPLLYGTSESIGLQLADPVKARHNCHVYACVGTFQLSAAVAEQRIQDARSSGVDGIAVFNYHYLVTAQPVPGRVSAADLKGSVFTQAATIPAMPWRQTP